jgi:hypothetical protein
MTSTATPSILINMNLLGKECLGAARTDEKGAGIGIAPRELVLAAIQLHRSPPLSSVPLPTPHASSPESGEQKVNLHYTTQYYKNSKMK